MRVLHIPFSFHPDPVGGTEVYVEALARQQQIQGIEAIIAAPGDREDEYWHRGIKVWRFPIADRVADIRSLYGDGDVLGAKAFSKVLDRERPDVVHLHAFTRGASLLLVREAKRRGTPVVFNYHTPTVSCQRGTLLRYGTEVCDGTLDVRACSQCALHGLGLNEVVSRVVGSLPGTVGRIAGSAGLSGGLWTAVRMTELVALRHAAFRSLMTEVDHVVAMCQWVKDVLLRNGVPEEKITVSRQGLCQSEDDRVATAAPVGRLGSRLRVIFLGRLDPTKGVHVLVQTMKAAPTIPVQLDIYGVVQGEAGTAYLRHLRKVAEDDRRITFRDSIPAEEVATRMCEYDVLAVPSQWLETGPMVVLEAFAAGLPVIGSNLGGIAELVTHGVDGLLVQTQSANAWRRTLERLCDDGGLLSELRAGVRPPRRIADVTTDMSGLYARLLGAAIHA